MTPKELEAYTCLSGGTYLINPAYANDKTREENNLKEKCRKCWQFREHFPKWVLGYIETWSKSRVAPEGANERAGEAV